MIHGLLASIVVTGYSIIPEGKSVFDYYLDLKSYTFLPWSERKKDSSSSSKYVSLSEVL